MKKECIFITGKDPDFWEMLRMRLLTEGFDVYTCGDEKSLLQHLTVKKPDLVIIDATIPGQNGVETCIRLREKINSLIYIISSYTSDTDKVTGFGVGADICISHPFSMSVLIAQIHASFRRQKLSSKAAPTDGKNDDWLIDYHDLKINTKSRSVIVNYKPVFLTAIEFDILAFLAGNPNQVFYTSQIFRSVWYTDNSFDTDERTVTVHISNLRKKIESNPVHPKYIITVRGVGYKFNSPLT